MANKPSNVTVQKEEDVESPKQTSSNKKDVGTIQIIFLIINFFAAVFVLLVIFVFFFWIFRADGINIFMWHPVAMSIGVVCSISGSMLSFSNYSIIKGGLQRRDRRVIVHWSLQTITFMCVVFGMGVMVLYRQVKGRPHFTSQHAFYGLIAVGSLIFAIFLGTLTNYRQSFKCIPPIVFKIVHTISGFTAYGFCGYSLILGFQTNWFLANNDQYDVFFAMIAVVIIWIFATLPIVLKIWHPPEG